MSEPRGASSWLEIGGKRLPFLRWSVLRMIFSMFGRAISVRASIAICSSTFGCTARPVINGFSTVCVSTKTRAVAS